MKDYTPAMSFGADVAEDLRNYTRGDEHAAVAFLAVLAGVGPGRAGSALELAIGTGRIALPLAARGVRVDGIELSPDMVVVLRERPGGSDLAVTEGNYRDVDVPGTYPLIYIVWNTFHNLLTQDDQVRCFENVAAHLAPGGAFVIEAGSPDWLYGLRQSQYVDAEAIGTDFVRLDVARHDPVTQILEESHVTLSASGIRLNPIVTRYAWPSELDLMARIAGLRLRERWGGWDRQPYAPGCPTVVSVFEHREAAS